MSERPVITYARVSTDEQGDTGLGLDAQAATIAAGLAQRGWREAEAFADVASGRSMNGRPGLAAAITRAKQTRGILVAAKLDRISRDVIDFAQLLSRAEREGWDVLVLDLPIDTMTPAGRFTALTMANAAELERRLVGERTSAALKALKARGVRLGPKGKLARTPDEVKWHVVRERAAGRTWQSIADGLNASGVPTVRGGARWRVSSVQSAHQSYYLDREALATLADRMLALLAAGSSHREVAAEFNAELAAGRNVPLPPSGASAWSVPGVRSVVAARRRDLDEQSAGAASSTTPARAQPATWEG